jgi:hypothetical protein
MPKKQSQSVTHFIDREVENKYIMLINKCFIFATSIFIES